MNFVKRFNAPIPKVLLSEHVLRQRRKAEDFFQLKTRSRNQRRLELTIEPIRAELTKALADLFHQKCAYCERKVDPARQVIDHYRPQRSTVGQNGETYLHHYWWLSFDWTNLYLCCPDCDKM